MVKIIFSLLAGGAGFFAAFSMLTWLERWRLRKDLLQEISLGSRSLSIRKFFADRSERAQFSRALPDFFDLLALGVSSGQNIEQAFLAASSRCASPVLRRRLDPLCIRLHLGLPREDVFESLRQALGDDRAASTITLLLQASQHGSPLDTALREQAETLRRHHQLTLEKKAQTIGLKLLLPIGVFILPALLLLFIGAFSLLLRQTGGLLSW